MVIVKRDNVEVPFDKTKITNAISKAISTTGEAITVSPDKLTEQVLERVQGQLTVEKIQDVVEKVLMDNKYFESAKAYITYRQRRTFIRDGRSELMDTVQAILNETNRDNANVGNSPSAKVLQISEAASKSYYLNRVINEKFAQAHREGQIYIHDMSWYGKTLTCLQIPLAKLFTDGFASDHGYIRTPKSIRSATALAAIILQANQNDMHGGQSYAAFDRDLAPFVEREIQRQEKKISRTGGSIEHVENFVKEETFQAMEALIYNLNSMHSRAGAQVPFSSINLGLDTTKAGRIVTEAFLIAYEKGLGKGEPPIFPSVCFSVKKGVNFDKGDPNYDLFKLAMRVSSKRLFPSYSFQDSSFNINSEEPVGYMGCRTRVVSNINGPGLTDGRGNLSFTSINLPRLAIKTKNIEAFNQQLRETMELCIGQLIERYKIQKNLKVSDMPFLMGQGLYMGSENLNLNDSIEPAIKHGTLAIGFIGLAETLKMLVGKHHGESQKAQKTGQEIIRKMSEICDGASIVYGLNFSLLATPAESLSGRLVAIDRKEFGLIPGVTDKEWYTNSFHVPVEYKITAREKIAIEAPYHKFCKAGHISYIEVDMAENIEGYESLIKHMANCDMGYGAINFPLDICKDCGTQTLADSCHKCNSKNISRIRRITGYLSTLDRFNNAKAAEEKNRVKHI